MLTFFFNQHDFSDFTEPLRYSEEHNKTLILTKIFNGSVNLFKFNDDPVRLDQSFIEELERHLFLQLPSEQTKLVFDSYANFLLKSTTLHSTALTEVLPNIIDNISFFMDCAGKLTSYLFVLRIFAEKLDNLDLISKLKKLLISLTNIENHYVAQEVIKTSVLLTYSEPDSLCNYLLKSASKIAPGSIASLIDVNSGNLNTIEFFANNISFYEYFISKLLNDSLDLDELDDCAFLACYSNLKLKNEAKIAAALANHLNNLSHKKEIINIYHNLSLNATELGNFITVDIFSILLAIGEEGKEDSELVNELVSLVISFTKEKKENEDFKKFACSLVLQASNQKWKGNYEIWLELANYCVGLDSVRNDYELNEEMNDIAEGLERTLFEGEL